ncbi:restriction endonuclease subunit S [Vibrio sp. CUB2]|uniref:restriction endonuclease subunit S n=1 Tax=Vibrio sp. CUB2 TaxID=2315233 RepID=UPI000769E652|nr:restriction endonuclease subunit S [Vibrio sp. CUB2]
MSNELFDQGWVSATIGDYLYLKNGYAFKSKDYVEASNQSVPIIRISDLNGNIASDDNAAHVLNGIDGFEVHQNDLLIAMSGATTGKVGIYRGKEPAYQNQRVGNIKLHSEEYGNTNYRNYLISALSKQILDIAYGGAQPNISGKAIEAIEIVLPSLAEQKIIAEKLDTLLAQVEATKARLESALETLKQFRQSVLAAAVSGKLTEDLRSPKDKYTEFAGYMVPSSWLESSIGKECEYVTSGSRGWAKYYSESGSLFIRSQDINSDELKIQDAAYVRLPEKVEGQRTKVQIDDLLITITGANVTKCARIKCNLEDAYISQHVALVRLKSSGEAAFFELVLKAQNAGRKKLQAMAYGGGKPGLNLQNIKDVEFAKPTTSEEVDTIIRRVENLLAGADTTEQQVNQALKRVNNLTQSILAKAFRGELTEQWRKENPDLISGENSAEALLKKIKAERAAAKPKRKAGKARA